jgi:hypothetical protein
MDGTLVHPEEAMEGKQKRDLDAVDRDHVYNVYRGVSLD